MDEQVEAYFKFNTIIAEKTITANKNKRIVHLIDMGMRKIYDIQISQLGLFSEIEIMGALSKGL